MCSRRTAHAVKPCIYLRGTRCRVARRIRYEFYENEFKNILFEDKRQNYLDDGRLFPPVCFKAKVRNVPRFKQFVNKWFERTTEYRSS